MKPLLDPHQQATLLFCASLAILAVVYDALVTWRWGSSASISWTLALVSRRWPVVSLGCAALLGHVFLVRWAPDLLSLDNLVGLGVVLIGLGIGATTAAQKPEAGRGRKDGDDDGDEGGRRSKEPA